MCRAVDTLLIQPNQGYDPVKMNAKVEDRVRTYMQAGIRPEELEVKASEKVQLQLEWQGRWQSGRAS